MSLRREPAVLWMSAVAPIVAVLAAFVFAANSDAQTWINAVAVAAAGFITAALVRSDNLLPALIGLVQAVLALLVGFGVDLPSPTQALIVSAVGVVAGIVVRDRVTAPVVAEPAAG